MKKIEILAPVGNKEMLMTAVANQADAVYLGLENFNARAKADNFNSDNIRETVRLCHLYGIKVYITVNTLISDKELPSVILMIEKAYLANADAFIIQDIGLARVLKETFPNIELHASTQMGVCNVYGAKVLEKLGFSRVVVARETTLEDIKQIKKETNLEIEAFIQGALCVCYSGSCYLSSKLKNKSGNRGECLQLCRLPYKLVENGVIKKHGYLLSTRDISLIERIDDLINAGVCSLKIEGRLRRPAYLAQSINSVRNVLNNKSLSKQEDFNLKKVFSRGEFNKGIYLDNKNVGGLINSDVNNHLGVKIGKVKRVLPFKEIYKILIESTHNICLGDGLKFIDKIEQSSMGVGSVKKIDKNLYEVYGKAKPNVGCDVYLTVDSVSEENLLNKQNLISVDAEIIAKVNTPLTIKLKSKDSIIEYIGEVLSSAKNQPITSDDIIQSMKKTGDTYFKVNNIKVETDNVFIAKSVLNNSRRVAYSMLEEKIIESYEMKNCKQFSKIEQNNRKNIQLNTDFNFYLLESQSKLDKIKDKKAQIIYAPDIYNIEDINKIRILVKEKFGSKLYLYLPVIANYRDLKIISSILSNFCNSEIAIVAGSIYGLYFLEMGYEVVVFINNNIANKETVTSMQLLGVKNIVSSIETNLFPVIGGCHEYVGNPPLMTVVMCPFIEHKGSSCDNCKYNKDSSLIMDDGTRLKIRRTKINDCYFELYQDKKITIPNGNGYVIDLRD